jgi:hypothetical protein
MKLGILARVRNNYQHGYINSKGKQIIECKFDEAGGVKNLDMKKDIEEKHTLIQKETSYMAIY